MNKALIAGLLIAVISPLSSLYASAAPEPAPTAAQAQAFISGLADVQVQRKAESMRLGYIDGRPATGSERKADTDSMTMRVVEYYYDQFRNSLDPDMPYFLFMSKGAKMTLGVGGGVRMRAFYDWGGAMPTNAFQPSTIPIPSDPTAPRHFGTTASGTYINMIMIGKNDRIGDYGLYIEGEFTGYQGVGFKLNKSYARVRDFTFGLATSTFSDPAAQPAIVDAAGPNNKFDAANVLVRWMPRISSRWLAALSVETPKTAVDETGAGVRSVRNWLPDAAALGEFEWAQSQHVRLAGIVRSLSYLTVADARRHNLCGWGLQLSAVGRPMAPLTLRGTVNYGQGYAGLGGDLVTGAYDLVADPRDADRLYAPDMLGWSASAQWNFRPDLFASLTGSQTHYMPRSGTAGSEYKTGTFLAANIFWSILPRLTVAAEYDWGQRRNIDRTRKSANRANLTAMFTF